LPSPEGLLLEARDTGEGTEWWLTGRGDPVGSYSVWTIRREICARLTVEELREMGEAGNAPEHFVERLRYSEWG